MFSTKILQGKHFIALFTLKTVETIYTFLKLFYKSAKLCQRKFGMQGIERSSSLKFPRTQRRERATLKLMETSVGRQRFYVRGREI